MSETVPEEHLQRLELATRAAELVPTTPQATTGLIRAGMAGEVPLRLTLRKDGTLEIRAKAPHPLPDGLEIQRDASEGLRIQAFNPAVARRLSSRAELRKRLEALFEAVPEARVSDGAVLLELPPEVKGDPLQGALRATLRAASTLSDISQELTLAAERNREQVRSTAVPEELEGGRRFIKLLPEKRATGPESLPQKETRLIGEAKALLSEGSSHEEVLAHIRRELANPIRAKELLDESLKLEPREQRQATATAVLTLSIMAISFFALYLLGRLDRQSGKFSAVIATFIAMFSVFPAWKIVGWFLDRRGQAREKDGLYRSVFKPDDD